MVEDILDAEVGKVHPGADGLILVPYWNSTMNPYWDDRANRHIYPALKELLRRLADC
jgi:hypothetical protein